MSEDKFNELVNLYFDREISAADLLWLKQELARNARRKQEFAGRLRLNRAMRLLLNPDEDFSQDAFDAEGNARVGRLSVWFIGSGVAACLSIGFVLLAPVLVDSSRMDALAERSNIDGQMSELERSDLRRFAASKEQSPRGSLAAQLRLSGLRPDMAPQDRQLEAVDLAAIQRQEELQRHQIDLLKQFEGFLPVNEPHLFQSMPRAVRAEATPRWPSGFEASLASF